MSQSITPINTKLIDSLVTIILSLSEEEQRLLEQKVWQSQYLETNPEQKREALQQDLTLGIEQLNSGEYQEYDDSTLPNLLETIRVRGQQKLRSEQTP